MTSRYDPQALAACSLGQLAALVRSDWRAQGARHPQAVPYLAALEHATETQAPRLVGYFLDHATHWRGEIAQEIKAELRRRAKL